MPTDVESGSCINLAPPALDSITSVPTQFVQLANSPAYARTGQFITDTPSLEHHPLFAVFQVCVGNEVIESNTQSNLAEKHRDTAPRPARTTSASVDDVASASIMRVVLDDIVFGACTTKS